jgi:alpha-tubulin suppressor-like RCC1 family protein
MTKRWMMVFVCVVIFCSIPAVTQAVQPQVVAGYYHTLALDADGRLWAWGGNSYGVLGDGTYVRRLLPVPIGGSARWKMVAAGTQHNLAIAQDGTLWAWGSNYYSQLGTNDGQHHNTPTRISTETGWTAIAAGEAHSLALKSDGTLWAWGDGGYGQLGMGDNTRRYVPTRVGTNTDWRSISAGNFHTMAIRTNGTLWAWGSNDRGQLGLGHKMNRNVPYQVGTDTTWTQVAAGNKNTYGIKSNNTLWRWGDNTWLTPAAYLTSSSWTRVVNGFGLAFGFKTDGTVWGWDVNNCGQVGNNTTVWVDPPASLGANWMGVSSSLYHSAGFKNDGSVYGWGSNADGQVGDGTYGNNRLVPTRVLNLSVGVGLVVVSDPANQGSVSGPGITCGSQGSDCQESYLLNQQVTLTALEEPGYTLHYWDEGGVCTYFTTQYVVNMNAAKTVTAKFAPLPGISVSINLQDAGTVTEDVAENPRVTCPGDCEEALDFQQSINLRAIPSSASYDFIYWMIGEENVGSENPKSFTITDPTNITAVFLPKAALVLVPEPPGGGVVSSDPGGIVCGNGNISCEHAFPSGGFVTLTATNNTGYELESWVQKVGEEETVIGTGPSCVVPMDAPKTVIARFHRVGQREPGYLGLFFGVKDCLEAGCSQYIRGDLSAQQVSKSFNNFPNIALNILIEGDNTNGGEGIKQLQIEQAINAAKNMSQPGDTLWIYIAAHGIVIPVDNQPDDNAVLTGPSYQQDPNSYEAQDVLLASELASALNGIDSVKKLISMDVCFSGGFWESFSWGGWLVNWLPSEFTLQDVPNTALLAGAHQREEAYGHDALGFVSMALTAGLTRVGAYLSADNNPQNHDLAIEELGLWALDYWQQTLYPTYLPECEQEHGDDCEMNEDQFQFSSNILN